MRVLSVVHGPEARAELFEPVVVAAGHAIDEWSFSWGRKPPIACPREAPLVDRVPGGHAIDEWSFSWGRKPPRPLESYDAYMVFGGAIHPDQEAQHTWMPQEIDWLERI